MDGARFQVFLTKILLKKSRKNFAILYKSAGVDKIGLKNYENSLKKQLNNIYKEE